ncbi:winged helix-turn-helix domain-containing protein [Arthrobacter zhangbolii]|uniref:Winged helix-turn-helix domain-containing protein n=1 Tax=Arthrobacter zhangbolii TaxID=2886936 RepID=A0A9X1M5S8_9MICC|nr:winged helix-turn-helix domain-containing protein [Arthrobacter zhangbolii]MCC3271761.1 winged helix-turn-helix domain-containing protein [Arthrobacter zhangbolii]UON93412.1 winged helix-turn-helix domain-containing protein [Arthrobacter zhangbolii]
MTQESRPAPRRAPTEEEAKALASAIRLRILRLCFKEQLTNKEIATRLGANPATVLYHVRKLVSTGFLEAQEARSGPSGAYEVPYLATEKSWRLEQDGHDLDVRQAVIGAFVDEMGQVPASDEVLISRLAVQLTKEGHDRFLERVMGILEEIKAEETDEEADSTRYSIFLAVHPESQPGQPGQPRHSQA